MEGCQLLVGCRMETEEEAFFDTRQALSPPPTVTVSPWSAGGLSSVSERRERFMTSMGLECSVSPKTVVTVADAENEEEEIVLEHGMLSSQSDENDYSMSSWSTKRFEEGEPDDYSLSGSIKDGGSKVGRTFSSLSLIQRLTSRSGKLSGGPKAIERRRNVWLRRLGLRIGLGDHGEDEATTSSSDSGQIVVGRYERVKVRAYQKRSKELSALYQGQVIKAHDSAILTMKFSPDGQFLASGGEDGVVRVWGVMQSEDCGIPMDDPSCVYLRAHTKCRLAPVNLENARKNKIKGMKQSSQSACVVIPSTVFHISEEPLHEFIGHCGDVLNLSWSNNKVS
jgi:WD40 repeat protein